MLKLCLALLVALAVSGCGLVYKVDVYQGSLLESKAVEQLEPGMSKRQVFALLGSPSVQDPFHHERWDYIASVRKRGGDTEVKALVLTFQGDTLASIEGEYFPEADEELIKEMRRYGNLPRSDKQKKARGG
jgi:outer membrane protein assembly factor BamE